MDLRVYLEQQIAFSLAAFGPGDREAGVLDHMKKEMIEIQDATTPEDKLAEWIDLVILSLDGAWRTGATPQQIVEALEAKLTKNIGRKWPDWRAAEPGKAIEHDRSYD